MNQRRATDTGLARTIGTRSSAHDRAPPAAKMKNVGMMSKQKASGVVSEPSSTFALMSR